MTMAAVATTVTAATTAELGAGEGLLYGQSHGLDEGTPSCAPLC